MRTASGWLCDTRGRPGCENDAAVAWFCTVEGREVALCGPCNRAWRARAAADPGLAVRCPFCASHVAPPPPVRVTPTAPTSAMPPMAPDLASALDHAMFCEGMLIDVRQRVLSRLGVQPQVATGAVHR